MDTAEERHDMADSPSSSDPDARLTGSKRALARPFGRVRAWLDMLLVDHGFLRVAYRHWKPVGHGMFRSNQPAPYQLSRARKAGIRTILNLRGPNDSGHYHLEVEACARLGLTLVDFPIKSRRAPPRDTILEAARLFERTEYPALLHCKSGIDRTGLMSAVFLLVRGETVETALRQFSPRYGYLGAGPTGFGKAFICAYKDAQEATGIAFLDWVRDAYDADALTRNFKPNRLTSAVVNVILRRE